MSSELIELDAIDLSIAALLVLVAGGSSLVLRLKLESQLAIASLRTVVQLLSVGYLLRFVFELGSAFAVGVVMVLMIVAASRAAVQRPTRTVLGAGWRAFGALVVSALLTTFAVTAVIVRVDPWYAPQYLIPLLGMVLGNSLTGISLCLDQLFEQFSQRRGLVEMELTHGATRWEAARGVVSDSVRRGMIPIINSMTVVGIVSLPGMMTGQILAGSDPLDAVKYQIVVMFMIASATSLGCVLVSLLMFRRLFNGRHQLLHEQIVKRG